MSKLSKGFFKSLCIGVGCLTLVCSPAVGMGAKLPDVYPTITKNLISNFNLGTDSWLRTENGAFIKNSEYEDNAANKYISMSVSEDGGSCTMAKNFRAMTPHSIIEFKIQPDFSNGMLDVFIYDRGSYPIKLFSVEKGNILAGDGFAAECSKEGYTKISAVINPDNTCSLYTNEKLIRKNIKFNSFRNLSFVSGIKFVYSSDAASTLRLDDVYAYSGKELMDEFSILGNIDKAVYRTKDAVALTLGYQKCFVNGILKDDIGIKGVKSDSGDVFVSGKYVLENMGGDVVYDSSKFVFTLGNHKVTFTPSESFAQNEDGSAVSLRCAPVLSENDIMICADDISKIFGLSKYFDGEDLLVLSSRESVFESTDDVALLVNIIREKMTNLTYASDSLGRRVKIGKTLDLFAGKPLEIMSVSSAYIPEAQNPPEASVDGDHSTRFAYDKYDNTLDVDFGSVKDISAYAISWYNGSQRKNHYRLHYSEDGVTWHSLDEVYSTGTTDVYEYTGIDIRARYIKYQGFGTYANDGGTYGIWNSVSEIAFFGEE